MKVITEKEAILSHPLYIYNLNCTYFRVREELETGLVEGKAVQSTVILSIDLTKCSILWKVSIFLI